MSSPLEDVFMVDKADGDVDGVTSEDSPSSDSLGEGSDSETEGEAVKPAPVDNRVAEAERKTGEMESRIAELLYENAALKTNAKTAEASGEKEEEFSLEALKEFSTKDEGKHTFDAGVHYTNQAVSRLEAQIKELRATTEQTEEQAVNEVVNDILPGLNDRSSENYRKVQNEALAMQRRGIATPAKAWEAAMFKVAATSQKPVQPAKGREEYSAKRAREEAGGTGAPTGGEPKVVEGTMTKDQLVMAKRMGMKSVFHTDPKVRAKARKVFLTRSKDYAERRIT